MKLDRTFLERFAAAAVDEGLADVVFDTIETPIGKLLVAQSKSGLCKVAFDDETQDEVLAKLARAIGPRVLSCHIPRPKRRATSSLHTSKATRSPSTCPSTSPLISSEFQRNVLKTLWPRSPGADDDLRTPRRRDRPPARIARHRDGSRAEPDAGRGPVPPSASW